MSYRGEKVKEYQKDLKELRRRHKASEDDGKKTVLSGMISSTEYAMFWIESGHERRPGETYSVTKLSKSQRTQLWGQIEHAPMIELDKPVKVSVDLENKLNDILSVLSEREREVYLSIVVALNTQEETAEIIGVERGTVKKYLDRAREKITQQVTYGYQQTLEV